MTFTDAQAKQVIEEYGKRLHDNPNLSHERPTPKAIEAMRGALEAVLNES